MTKLFNIFFNYWSIFLCESKGYKLVTLNALVYDLKLKYFLKYEVNFKFIKVWGLILNYPLLKYYSYNLPKNKNKQTNNGIELSPAQRRKSPRSPFLLWNSDRPCEINKLAATRRNSGPTDLVYYF